jgi:hypothetical protein
MVQQNTLVSQILAALHLKSCYDTPHYAPHIWHSL